MIAQQVSETTIESAIEEIFTYFNVDGGKRSEVVRIKRFEDAKKVVSAQPEQVVGLVASEFNTPNYQRKVASYRIIIGLGIAALEVLKNRLKNADELERLWLVSILHYYGDHSQTHLMADLAKKKACYPGHLAALALVFQGKQQAVDGDSLLLTLIGALLSEEKIEESAFFVADSALGCLRLLTGASFSHITPSSVHFYNFDQYLFTPPIHPFPYTSDRVNTLLLRQRRQLVDQVMGWWEKNRTKSVFKTLVSCFEQ